LAGFKNIFSGDKVLLSLPAERILPYNRPMKIKRIRNITPAFTLVAGFAAFYMEFNFIGFAFLVITFASLIFMISR
jgi:hypothetical protein